MDCTTEIRQQPFSNQRSKDSKRRKSKGLLPTLITTCKKKIYLKELVLERVRKSEEKEKNDHNDKEYEQNSI